MSKYSARNWQWCLVTFWNGGTQFDWWVKHEDIFFNSDYVVEKAISPLVHEDSHHPPLYLRIKKILRSSFFPFRLNIKDRCYNFKNANYPLLYDLLACCDWTLLKDLNVRMQIVFFFFVTSYNTERKSVLECAWWGQVRSGQVRSDQVFHTIY